MRPSFRCGAWVGPCAKGRSQLGRPASPVWGEPAAVRLPFWRSPSCSVLVADCPKNDHQWDSRAACPIFTCFDGGCPPARPPHQCCRDPAPRLATSGRDPGLPLPDPLSWRIFYHIARFPHGRDVERASVGRRRALSPNGAQDGLRISYLATGGIFRGICQRPFQKIIQMFK